MNFSFTKTVIAFILIAGLLFASSIKVQAQTQNIITTLAGDTGYGYSGDGVQATAASLARAQGVAVDSFGNVYITDCMNNRIRKVDQNTGIISTYAGTGVVGYTGDGGQATAARLSDPIGINMDDTGNVVITDNNCIRKISRTTGIITTIAGKGVVTGYSGDGGPATDAVFNGAFYLSYDRMGNLYVADEGNARIRKVDNATGIITTIAGIGSNGFGGDGGPATAAEFFLPTNVVVDTTGNVYISDAPLNSRVRKIDAKTGIINTVAGTGSHVSSGNGGPGTDAGFNTPSYLALDDSGNVFISDELGNEIRKLNATTGIVTAFAGNFTGGYTGDGGPATDAEVNYPSGLAVDPCGNLYFADLTNNVVRKVTVAHPSATTTIQSATSSTICPGKTVTFADTSNFNANKWVWHFNGGKPDSSTQKNPVIEYDSLGSYDVTVTAYSWCATVTKTFTKYINVIHAPPIGIVPQSPSVCSGQSILLNVNGGGTNFTWAPSKGLNITTGDSVIASPTATITYTVTGLDSLGCMATDSDVVTIIPAPNKPTFTQTGNVLTSSATQGNQWFRNDSLLSGATNQTYTVTIAGWYSVTVVNPANGCTTSSDSVYISPTGINQLETNNDLSIYPNPFNDIIIVKINSSVTGLKDWKLKLCDVLGRIVFTKESLSYTNNLDLSDLPCGTYFITVTNKINSSVLKVVKQN